MLPSLTHVCQSVLLGKDICFNVVCLFIMYAVLVAVAEGSPCREPEVKSEQARHYSVEYNKMTEVDDKELNGSLWYQFKYNGKSAEIVTEAIRVRILLQNFCWHNEPGKGPLQLSSEIS